MMRFEKHVTWSWCALILVVLNGVIGLYSLSPIMEVVTNGNLGFDFVRSLLVIALLLVTLISSVLIFFKSLLAIKLCFIAYLLQVFGLIYNESYYILSIGLWINWSILIENVSIEVNLVALVICISLLIALTKTNNTSE